MLPRQRDAGQRAWAACARNLRADRAGREWVAIHAWRTWYVSYRKTFDDGRAAADELFGRDRGVAAALQRRRRCGVQPEPTRPLVPERLRHLLTRRRQPRHGVARGGRRAGAVAAG